jgi:hypothetical protein
MYPDGTLLYGPPDPKIYVIQGGARHWIPNPQTFNADGYNWSAIVQTDQATLDGIALGAPITSAGSDGLAARFIQDIAVAATVVVGQARPAAPTANSRRRTMTMPRLLPHTIQAVHPLPAKPGRVLGHPRQRPDGAPPMVPVLLPAPRPGQPSHHTVRSLEQRQSGPTAAARHPPVVVPHPTPAPLST